MRKACSAGPQTLRLGCASPGACATRDSGSQYQAKIAFSTQSPAAMSPGPWVPSRLAKVPRMGPTTTPADVAAESQPSARARSEGRTVSATYAWATPVVPPPAPWTKRDRNSSQSVSAKPNTV